VCAESRPPPRDFERLLREILWLLKKISQPLKFAVITRSNFSRKDTQIWLASVGNVLLTAARRNYLSAFCVPERTLMA